MRFRYIKDTSTGYGLYSSSCFYCRVQTEEQSIKLLDMTQVRGGGEVAVSCSRTVNQARAPLLQPLPLTRTSYHVRWAIYEYFK